MRSIDKATPAVAQVGGAILAGTLLGYATGRRDRVGIAARATAAGLVLAAFVPSLALRLLTAGAARRRIHLRTSIFIDRPVHDVFTFCRDFENFPRVIQSLHRITDFQDGRSRWEVLSPRGELLTWDAQVTKYVPNVVIAWRSLRGSVVDCNGLIRFSPTSNGGTRLQIQVDYDPCTTGLSEAIRALLDTPREEQLEADLERANFYLRDRSSAPETARDPESDDSPTLSA